MLTSFLQTSSRRSRTTMLAVLLLGLAAAGCATPPEGDPVAMQAYEQANDPLEPTNRYIFDVNEALDAMVLVPVVTIYNEGVPDPYRQGVRNFISNLRMPITILNSGLQGDWNNMVEASVSFFINSTAGIAGIFDIPGSFGDAPDHREFGQTLGVWGVEEGPFIELPLVGPSNARDTVGLGVDILTDPLTYLLSPGLNYALTGMQAVQVRADLDQEYSALRDSSIDFYATLRSLYRQNRDRSIAEARASASGTAASDEPDLSAFDDFDVFDDSSATDSQ